MNLFRISKPIDFKYPNTREVSVIQKSFDKLSDQSGRLCKEWASRLSADQYDQLRGQIKRFSQLCQSVHERQSFSDEESIDLLSTYYSQLQLVHEKLGFAESKSGIFGGGDDSKALEVPFSWSDAFSGLKDKYISSHKVIYEQLSVLFNLASAYASLASKVDHSSIDGLKAASKLYLQASGVCEYAALKVEDEDESLDTSRSAFSWLVQYFHGISCLFTLEIAIQKRLPGGTLAKLAAGASEQFSKAFRLSSHTLKKFDFDDYQSTMIHYLKSCTELFNAEKAVQDEKYGQCIGRLVKAKRLVDTCKRKNCNFSALQSAVDELAKKIETKLMQAKKDNDNIYMQTVPKESELSFTESRILGKPVEPSFEAFPDFLIFTDTRSIVANEKEAQSSQVVEQLVSMGYDKDKSIAALLHSNNDLIKALDILKETTEKNSGILASSGFEDLIQQQSLPVSGQGKPVNVSMREDEKTNASKEEMVASLMSMGFPQTASISALKQSQFDFDKALYILSKPSESSANEADVNTLVSMGFDRDASISALLSVKHDVASAIHILAQQNKKKEPKSVPKPPLEMVQQLCFLGYQEENVIKALQKCGNSFEKALDSLSQQKEEEEKIKGKAADMMKIAQLMAMGFSKDDSKRALAETNNNVEEALFLLTD